MKFKELKEKGPDELQKMLGETRERVRALRSAVASSQHPKVRDIRVAKRTIARLLTIAKSASKPKAS